MRRRYSPSECRVKVVPGFLVGIEKLAALFETAARIESLVEDIIDGVNG
jgi:hypothetical protein